MAVKYVNREAKIFEYKGWLRHFLAGSSWVTYLNLFVLRFLFLFN